MSKNASFDLKNAKVEIDFLRKLMNWEELGDSEGHESIVQMLDHFKFRSHQAIVFELLSLNLYKFQQVHKQVFSKNKLKMVSH